jgi:hypothetical protein
MSFSVRSHLINASPGVGALAPTNSSLPVSAIYEMASSRCGSALRYRIRSRSPLNDVNVPSGIGVSNCGTNNVNFLASSACGFTAARQVQRLTDPLGDGNVARFGAALNFAIIKIRYDNLKPFAHMVSLSDPSTRIDLASVTGL